MSGHTPGPWRARGAVVFGPDIDGDPYLVAGSNAFAGAHYSPKRDEAEANARLIAAAPEMYEALKRSLAMMKLVAEDYSMGGNYSPKHIEILFSIRSAIAKAEGKQ